MALSDDEFGKLALGKRKKKVLSGIDRSKKPQGQKWGERREYVDSTSTIRREIVDNTSKERREYVDSTSTMEKDKVVVRREYVDSTSTQASTERRENVDSTSTNICYNELSGHELTLTKFLVLTCKNQGSTTTTPINNNFLIRETKIPSTSIRTIVLRLKEKRIIEELQIKKGPGGWRKFTLNKQLYKDALQVNEFNSTSTVRREYVDTSVYNTSTQASTKSPSSSSGDLTLKKITTTTVDNFIESVSEISIPLALTQIGFKPTQIKQILVKGVLSKKDIEESLEHFSYALEKKLIHPHTGPLNFLMGILVKKEVPYVCEQYVAELRAEKESVKKLQEEYHSLQKKESREVLVIKFEEYKKQLTKTEIDKIIPPNDIVKSGSDRQGILLKAHFEEKVV